MPRYYDFNGIYEAAKKVNCQNILIAGGKGNGKTFGAIRKGLTLYRTDGRVVRYARRHRESIRKSKIQSLLNPHNKWLETVSDGTFNKYHYYSDRFYESFYDSNGKKRAQNPEPCMKLDSINTWETDCGPDEGEAGIIIFDEAISRENELTDEFSSLMKYHNNCMRNRTDYFCPLVLLGNTVTRDCQIFEEFGVDLWKINDTDKGHIQYIKNRKGEINAIFEWCGTADVQNESREYYDRFENEKTKMITDGVFTLGEYKLMSPQRANAKGKHVFSIVFREPHFIIECEYRLNKYGFLFAFMHEFPNWEQLKTVPNIIINPLTQINTPTTKNYFGDSRYSDIFYSLYDTGNIYYDHAKTGEKYRSFAKKCIGLMSCVPD